ncbi:unnamed protein product, partial [Mesorhabditis belari]|uniref:M02D8-5-like third CUB domain-containing protein n=1 Tax=Mesorhabditis belari TaxID=2138241 RepID=A0AAF3EX97_9BILA
MVKLLAVKLDPADTNYAFSFQYFRFSLAPNDCIHFCDRDDGALCRSYWIYRLCGNAMFQKEVSDYVDSATALWVYFMASGTRGYFPGVMGQVTRVDKTTRIYNDCKKDAVVNLDTGNQFYALISDHWENQNPGNPQASAETNVTCQQQFVTNDKAYIRVAIQAYGNWNPDTEQTMNITGIASDQDSPTTIVLEKDLLYFKATAVYWFKGKIDLSYEFTADKQYFYYILITPYDEVAEFNDCQNAGNYDMQQVTSQALNFSALPKADSPNYSPGSNCKWKFSNTPQSHQLIARFDTVYIEECCDFVSIKGAGPMNLSLAHNPTNSAPKFFYETNSQGLELGFQSDSIEDFTMMSGQVTAVDCTCPKASVTLKANDSETISYGWNSMGFPVCSPWQCNTTVTFDRSSILQITLNYVSYFDLTIYDQFASLFQLSYQSSGYIQSGSFHDYNGHDMVKIAFSSPPLYTFDSFTPLMLDPGPMGYTFELKAVPVFPTQFDIDLCTSVPFAEVNSGILKKEFDAVVYQFDNRNCLNKPIIGYFFDHPHGFLVDIFDGNLQTGTLISTSFINSTLKFSSNIVAVRIVKLADPGTTFQSIFTTNEKLVVYQPDEDFCSGDGDEMAVDFVDGFTDRTIVIYRGPLSDYTNWTTSHLYGIDFMWNITNYMSFSVYQGASLAVEDNVYGKDSSCDSVSRDVLPSFVFGSFVTIRTLSEKESQLKYQCVQQAQRWTGGDQVGLMLAPRYNPIPKQLFANQYSWTVSVQNLTSNPSSSIRLNFLNPMAKDSLLTISLNVNKTLFQSNNYTTDSSICRLSFPYAELQIKYQWNCENNDDVTTCGVPMQIRYEKLIATTTTTTVATTTTADEKSLDISSD